MVVSLTHIRLVDPAILINWMSPFPIIGVSGVLFHFYSISNRSSCWQKVKTLIRHHILQCQTPRSAASDLGLHCLPMSKKWDARLIRVNRLASCIPYAWYFLSSNFRIITAYLLGVSIFMIFTILLLQVLDTVSEQHGSESRELQKILTRPHFKVISQLLFM